MNNGRRCHHRQQRQRQNQKQNRQQKYPIGTRFWKRFGRYGVFEGQVESYDDWTGYYVKYSDGDAEHLGQDDIDELIQNPTSPPPLYHQKYPLKTFFYKKFGKHGVFEGTIRKFDKHGGYYNIEYSDGDEEDLREEDIDKLIQNPPPPPRRLHENHDDEQIEIGVTRIKKFFVMYGLVSGNDNGSLFCFVGPNWLLLVPLLSRFSRLFLLNFHPGLFPRILCSLLLSCRVLGVTHTICFIDYLPTIMLLV